MIPKPNDRTRELAARDAYLRNLARRPARHAHRRRGSTRIEALVVTMLGLAIIAFPWGRLGPSREAEAQPLTYVRLQSGDADADTSLSDERSSFPRAYGGCNEARAAGAAPVYADDPGYGPWLDGDGDGIGCEPHRNKR
jgi:hypothetical protein